MSPTCCKTAPSNFNELNGFPRGSGESTQKKPRVPSRSALNVARRSHRRRCAHRGGHSSDGGACRGGSGLRPPGGSPRGLGAVRGTRWLRPRSIHRGGGDGGRRARRAHVDAADHASRHAGRHRVSSSSIATPTTCRRCCDRRSCGRRCWRGDRVAGGRAKKAAFGSSFLFVL
jgi:hypothetical protein